jgi:hypothetical protein
MTEIRTWSTPVRSRAANSPVAADCRVVLKPKVLLDRAVRSRTADLRRERDSRAASSRLGCAAGAHGAHRTTGARARRKPMRRAPAFKGNPVELQQTPALTSGAARGDLLRASKTDSGAASTVLFEPWCSRVQRRSWRGGDLATLNLVELTNVGSQRTRFSHSLRTSPLKP